VLKCYYISKHYDIVMNFISFFIALLKGLFNALIFSFYFFYLKQWVVWTYLIRMLEIQFQGTKTFSLEYEIHVLKGDPIFRYQVRLNRFFFGIGLLKKLHHLRIYCLSFDCNYNNLVKLIISNSLTNISERFKIKWFYKINKIIKFHRVKKLMLAKKG
jgi:hypothetical protein